MSRMNFPMATAAYKHGLFWLIADMVFYGILEIEVERTRDYGHKFNNSFR